MSYFAAVSGQAHYPATSLTAGAERPGCYRSGNAIEAFSWDQVWGTYFFYGGPGYSWTSNACKL